MIQLKKTLLTLVALFAISTGAWAAGTVYNTTVALKDLKAGDVLTDGFKLTTDKGQYIYVKGYKKDGGTAETGDYTQLNAYNSTFPGGVTISESGSTYTPYADGKDANAWIVSDFKDYGSATMLYLDGYNYTAAPAGKALNPDATRKVWTLDAMLAGNVELQVAYFPGMLTLPAKTAQGSIEVVGLGGETLPAGFDTDGTNIYVEPKTQFQVKAVPAEGYRLVSLSDGTNTYDVDADGIATITMPEGDADLTLTATFSDEFELTFDDVNFKTNQNITVKVGDADKTLDQDGKLSVKAGQTVTLTAKQGYKFRSVEAKKAGEPAAAGIVNPEVGQYIGSDGKNYDANATLPTGVTKVAKICYVGSETGEAAPYNHGLALALSDANGGSGCEWNTSMNDAGHTKQTSNTFTEESGLQYNDTHNSDTYPAFKAAIANNGTAAPTGCSSWFLASGYQWQKMLGAAGLSNLGLTENEYYWSSSEDDATHAWDFYSSNGNTNWYNSSKNYGDQVRACLAF